MNRSKKPQDRDHGARAELSESDRALLTEARTAKWKLEGYEFAYDTRVRVLRHARTLLEFLAVLVAVVFLFLQYLVKESVAAHAVLGYVGTGVSLVIILMVVWCHIAGWPGQIEKQSELSSEAHELISLHRKSTDARPLDGSAVKDFLKECLEFEEQRKHSLASVSRLCIKRGHQHVGRLYPNSGFTCAVCGREWKAEFNRRARWTWVPFFGCNQCGV